MNKDSLKELGNKEWHIPLTKKVGRVVESFSTTEKIIFYILAIVFITSGLTLLYKVNKMFLVEVPEYGGTLTEGIVGSPRFINPVLATSDADRDLTALVYSGLLKQTSSGEIIPDLATGYTVSPDGLTYTVTIKENAYFQDNTRLTADDVVFTIEKIQDTNLKSPRSGNWNGVRVQKIDDLNLTFTLKLPYPTFPQNLTIGILPRHIWKNISIEEFPFSQFNVKPIGSGPYRVDSQNYSGSGLPNQYILKSFNKYTLGKPYINNIVIKSYPTERDLIDAFKNRDVESIHGISPKQLVNIDVSKNKVILTPLPRIFGVFFNQNVAPVLLNKEVRYALDLATDKKEIVDKILGGYGKIIDSPIINEERALSDETSSEDRVAKAKALLEKNGWKLNDGGIYFKKEKKTTTTLSFSISTGDAPELKETALLLQKQWQKIGARVEVKIFEIGDLNQDIIKPRKYDSLLFGEVIGKDFDLYPFWHSSQRTSPGLNIAMYANVKTDKILENIRKTADKNKVSDMLQDFRKELINDRPAVFTYSPYFIYIVPDKVKGVEIGTLTYPGERFNDVNKWYIETNSIWKIFNN